MPYTVTVTFEVPDHHKKLWAIPIIGILAKLVILIPHIIVIYALGVVVGLLQLILWAFVLFGGKYPAFGYQLVGGYLRWNLRVQAFAYGLTDVYPPFTLEN
jgi:hypothetical protein